MNGGNVHPISRNTGLTEMRSLWVIKGEKVLLPHRLRKNIPVIQHIYTGHTGITKQTQSTRPPFLPWNEQINAEIEQCNMYQEGHRANKDLWDHTLPCIHTIHGASMLSHLQQ